ncbi:hypothetical protein [Streptomyces sp. NPDC001222]|uniref:hypothetical protein n=1 Tax=Streptomyces sp. NPDC001222 TaxID=3364548 RepID=UPI0036888A73
MAPPAGGIAGDVDADFHHLLGFHQRDVQRLPAAPPEGERPARPRMLAPAGASSPATVLLAAWARVVVRPVY